jgi:hypothetical protein
MTFCARIFDEEHRCKLFLGPDVCRPTGADACIEIFR